MVSIRAGQDEDGADMIHHLPCPDEQSASTSELMCGNSLGHVFLAGGSRVAGFQSKDAAVNEIH